MKGKLKYLPAVGLAVLMGGCIAAWMLTRDANVARPAKKSASALFVANVDERPLQTARKLAAMADTRSEQDLAVQAVRLADQELDQDFAIAIREAAASGPPAKGPLHDLAMHVAELKTRVDADQQRMAQLTKEAAINASASDKLELLKAQTTLDQDEFDDASGDLARQGGDLHANLERALAEHQAAGQEGPPAMPKVLAISAPGTLREQLQEWLSLGSRQDQLDAAQTEVEKKAKALENQHNVLEGKMAPAPDGVPASDDDSDAEDNTADVVAQLRHLSDQRKTMMDLDKRIQSCKSLGTVYQNWLGVLATRRRGVLHGVVGSLAGILAILLMAAVVRRVADRTLLRQTDRRRQHQLQVITNISIQFVTVLLILFIVFGTPTQMPTILGLAGAGLTVVLKDFIVAFFGWFVLMGRNGLRLGDWVEINGVGGEVVEIGVLKTVLLEMGNWTITGHPTGRRVSFMNGFAIEGHYFNFSTTGQWLWDELQVSLQRDIDPYKVAEQILRTVERATDADAKLAEEDWERVMHQYGTQPFSAKPAVDLRPGNNGLMVNVRYITRAPQRYEVKSRLFEAIVALIHQSTAAQSTA